VEPNQDRSLVPQPSRELVAVPIGANRILSEMVKSSLAVTKEFQRHDEATQVRLRITTSLRRSLFIPWKGPSCHGAVGFIDAYGKVVIQPRWENAMRFRGERAAVQMQNEWGFINVAGEVVIPPQWISVGHFWNDFAVIDAYYAKDGIVWGQGLIDKVGNVVVRPEWEYAEH
jgi:hypothetical protein